MEDSNEIDIYEKEHKIRDQLKEELLFITQNNLKNTVETYEKFTDQILNHYFNKKLDQMREIAANIPKKEKKPRVDNESKKIKENLTNETKSLQDSNNYMKEKIKEYFDQMFNENLKKLQNGIDELFDTDGINKNVKSVYQSLINEDFSVEKINENHAKIMKKFEDVYQQYLLKNLKYKEELAVYNKRQEQKLNENIDVKKEFNDINNYLNNFKFNNKKEKEMLKELDNLLDSL
jgi:hypothetical protein